MRRRFVLVLAATAAILGLGATAANAAFTHIYSPAPTGLVRACVGVEAADTGLCVHL